jgi:hypothetical protein
VASLGPLTVTHCTVTQNYGSSGAYSGGIVSVGSLAATTIANSLIAHNGTSGIYTGGGAVAFISQCTISDNTANGLVLLTGHTIDQCTVSGNGAFGLETGGSGKILNSTIVGNPVGIIANPSIGAGVIGNTIFDNDTDTPHSGFPVVNNKAPISLGHNLTRGNAGGDGATGPGGWLNQPTDIRNTDPLLGPLQDNGGPTPTHALLAGSPAINAGGGPDEMQAITVRGSAGTFTLTFNGATTATLPFNATAAQVQDALNALSSIGGVGGSVGVITNPDHNNDFFVNFSGGTLAGQNQPPMTGSSSGLSFFFLGTVSDGGGVPAFDQRGPGFPRVVSGQMDIGAFEAPTATTTTSLAASPNPSVFGQADYDAGDTTEALTRVLAAQQRLQDQPKLNEWLANRLARDRFLVRERTQAYPGEVAFTRLDATKGRMLTGGIGGTWLHETVTGKELARLPCAYPTDDEWQKQAVTAWPLAIGDLVLVEELDSRLALWDVRQLAKPGLIWSNFASAGCSVAPDLGGFVR